jgi:hypothetical protein
MSMYQPHYAEVPTGAGGEATLGEIYDAAELAHRTGGNLSSPEMALEEAYKQRIDAIEAATGERLEHPRARALRERGISSRLPAKPWKRAAAMDNIPAELEIFETEMRALAEKYPDAADAFALDVPFEDQAHKLMAEAEADQDRLFSSRKGLAKYGAMFAGTSVAAIQEPIELAMLVLGGGVGAARTVAQRIATVAIKEALINGTSEAALQPFVQKWRTEAGLQDGFEYDRAIEQILYSTAFGGVFGGGARAIGEGGQALGRYLKDRPSPVADAVNGDIDAMFNVLSPAREHLPADARGALDAIEADRVTRTERRKGIDPEFHDALTARALDDLQSDAPSNRLGEGLDAQRRIGAGDDADIVASGPHGPILDRIAYEGNWAAAVARLQGLQDGEIPGALFHSEIGDIDVIWGLPEPKAGTKGPGGAGLAKIIEKHPEVVADLPRIIGGLDVQTRSANRIQLENDEYKAVVRLEHDGNQKTWLLTAFEKETKGRRRVGSTVSQPAEGASRSAPAPKSDIGSNAGDVQQGAAQGNASDLDQTRNSTDQISLDTETPAQRALTQVERLEDDLDHNMELPNGFRITAEGDELVETIRLQDALDEIDREAGWADLIGACRTN